MSLRYGVECVPALYGGFHWIVIDRNLEMRHTRYAGVRSVLTAVSRHHTEEAADEMAQTLNALEDL